MTQAFIRYMISSNIGEVLGVFMFSLFGLPDGFNSIQLLLVNLITDGFPAMALSFNPADEDIMLKPPRSKDDGIVNSWVLIRYFSIGIYIGLATVGVFVYWYCFYFWAPDGHTLVEISQLANWTECPNWSTTQFTPVNFGSIDFNKVDRCSYFTSGKTMASTMSLTVIILVEMFNCWNAVSEKNSLFKTGLTSNRYLLPVTLGCIAFYALLLYLPGIRYIFSLEPLSWQDWLVAVIFSLPVILIEEGLKYLSQTKVNQPVTQQQGSGNPAPLKLSTAGSIAPADVTKPAPGDDEIHLRTVESDMATNDQPPESSTLQRLKKSTSMQVPLMTQSISPRLKRGDKVKDD